MRRVPLVIIILAVLLLPIVFFVVRQMNTPKNSDGLWPLKKYSQSNDRYSVVSEDPRYTISILDSRYIEYVVENIGVLKAQAVIGPEYYTDDALARYTVTNIKFIIVPYVDDVIVAIPGDKDFSARANYRIDKDTLIVRVSFSQAEVLANTQKDKYIENIFLRASLQTLHFAHGLFDDQRSNAEVFRNVQQSIQEYLYPGVLPWPIQITVKE